MAINTPEDITLGPVDSRELQLPQADYGVEVRAMVAVLAQLRSLIVNLEGLLFNMQVYSHKPPEPDRQPIVVLEDGDIVTKIPERLVKGFTGICRSRETPDVCTPADEQGSTDSGSN